MARLDREVAQAHTVIGQALEHEARRIQATLSTDGLEYYFTRPDPKAEPTAANGWPCAPQAVTASGPWYCTFTFLAERGNTLASPPLGEPQELDDLLLIGSQYYPPVLTQIPVAIRWKLRPNDPVHVNYGWVLVDEDTLQVSYILHDHQWCAACW